MRFVYLTLILFAALNSRAQTTTMRNYKLVWNDSVQQTQLLNTETGARKTLRVHYPRQGGNFFLLDSFIVIRDSDMRSLFNLKGEVLVENACLICAERREVKVKMCNRNVYYLNQNGKLIKSYGAFYHGGPLLDTNLIDKPVLVYSGTKKGQKRYEYVLNEDVVNFFYVNLAEDSLRTFHFRLHNHTGGRVKTFVLDNGRGVEVKVLDTATYIEPYYPLNLEVTTEGDYIDGAVRVKYLLDGKQEEIWIYVIGDVPSQQRFIEINYEGDTTDPNRMADPENGYRLSLYWRLDSFNFNSFTEQCRVKVKQDGRVTQAVMRKDYRGGFYHEVIPEPGKPFTLIVKHKNGEESTHYFSLEKIEESKYTRRMALEIEPLFLFAPPGKKH